MKKRIIRIVAVLAVLCGSVLVLPVSAAQPNTSKFWNWEDLISESIITGDTKTTTVIFPNAENSPPYPSWGLFTYDWASLGDYSVVDPADMSLKITWPLDSDGVPAAPLNNGVRLRYRPFGYVTDYFANPGMYVENVPNGTELSFSMSITYGLGSIAELFTEDITLTVYYMSFIDTSHVTTLSSMRFTFDVEDAIYDPAYMVTLPFSFVLDKPETCNTIWVEINLGVLKYYPGDVNSNVLTVAPSPLVMTFENSVMGELLDKIDSGNQTMDKIYDALTPTPEQNDKAEQMEQEIGNAAGSLENNNSSLEQLTPTRPDINTDLQLDEDSLLAVSPLVTNIWSISGMGRMIGIVLVVATVAYIFFGKRDG